ncbi:TPA: DUF3927 domain-containing protein [Klebsiella quasipneumoniae]|nr:DUF3927 domain-containing protein [Klebsiella quasipneumoniae]
MPSKQSVTGSNPVRVLVAGVVVAAFPLLKKKTPDC